MRNPFFCDGFTPVEKFVGRKGEIRRLVNNIRKGSSTIIVGDPKIGKTSLLMYLFSSENRNIYGGDSKRLKFQYIDMHTFDHNMGPHQFWCRAIKPWYEAGLIDTSLSAISKACLKCVEDDFLIYNALPELFEILEGSGLRMVLLLDEFDVVPNHPKLNTRDFLGKFRSLSTRYSALSVIIATRQSRAQLNHVTGQYNDGSPYFNAFNEIVLGKLHNREITQVLDWAKGLFTTYDRRRLVELTGGHPYLLQAAASELWYTYHEILGHNDERWQQVEEKLYRESTSMFREIWRMWSPEMRITFIAVALSQAPLEKPKFRPRAFIAYLKHTSLSDNLRELASRGLIVEDDNLDSGWRVCSLSGLCWLGQQIVDEIRDDVSCREWLQRQQLVGFLTVHEQRKWIEYIKSISEFFRDSAKTLVESLAKGIGESMVK